MKQLLSIDFLVMSFWQTHFWKELILASNQAQEVFDMDGVFVEKRSLGLRQFGLFILGLEKGTFLDRNKMIQKAKQEHCLFVQIETLSYQENPDFLDMPKGYYKKFITPYTALIDLSKSQDEIWQEMKPKGRYNIGLAQKKGVTVFEAENSDENIEIFYQLMQQTTTRDHFSGNHKSYYKNFLHMIPGATLIFTQYEGNILSAGIFVFAPEVSIYYYGASTSEKQYRNLMAPYGMQAYAIKKAKSIGSMYYDFLGVASPGDTHSPLAGVTDFKLKLTPNQRYVSQGYIIKISCFKYHIFQTIKFVKKLFLRFF